MARRTRRIVPTLAPGGPMRSKGLCASSGQGWGKGALPVSFLDSLWRHAASHAVWLRCKGRCQHSPTGRTTHPHPHLRLHKLDLLVAVRGPHEQAADHPHDEANEQHDEHVRVVPGDVKAVGLVHVGREVHLLRFAHNKQNICSRVGWDSREGSQEVYRKKLQERAPIVLETPDRTGPPPPLHPYAHNDLSIYEHTDLSIYGHDDLTIYAHHPRTDTPHPPGSRTAACTPRPRPRTGPLGRNALSESHSDANTHIDVVHELVSPVEQQWVWGHVRIGAAVHHPHAPKDRYGNHRRGMNSCSSCFSTGAPPANMELEKMDTQLETQRRNNKCQAAWRRHLDYLPWVN
jgi:hypothetical protein